jgi:predicted DsbA family dithiol-disulfide isomerase
VRWRRLEAEYAGKVELQWKSYLLRPAPQVSSDPIAALEKFRHYTSSWLRVAAGQDTGEFQVWQSDEGPPSHSVPAHLVSKAAARLGKDAFERIHERLMRAYFTENRDISNNEVLLELWLDVGLDETDFATAQDPELLQAVIDDHDEALECGATGVPAVRLEDNRAVTVGAHPIDAYRAWIDRTLARQEEDTGGDHL